jgi:hypothetical protein
MIPNPRVGELVILKELPKGLLGGLPAEDQDAIIEIIGKPIRVTGYEEDGRVGLEFTDSEEVVHIIYVSPSFLNPTR